MSTSPVDLTWRCHICHDERPDRLIDVMKSTIRLPDIEVPIQQNVRHCNDRPACIEAARTFTFLPGHKPVLIPDTPEGAPE